MKISSWDKSSNQKLIFDNWFFIVIEENEIIKDLIQQSDVLNPEY